MKTQPIQSRCFIFAVAATFIGCGTANDQEQAARPAADDTRYEIVIVDSSDREIEDQVADAASDSDPTPGAIADTPASPPPPPGIDDEAGGDQLLAFAPDGRFVVQVGVFSDIAKSCARVRELMDLGYPAFLVKREGASQTRVRIGFFSSRDDADQFGQRFVRDHGGEYWIDLRTGGGE